MQPKGASTNLNIEFPFTFSLALRLKRRDMKARSSAVGLVVVGNNSNEIIGVEVTESGGRCTLEVYEAVPRG